MSVSTQPSSWGVAGSGVVVASRFPALHNPASPTPPWPCPSPRLIGVGLVIKMCLLISTHIRNESLLINWTSVKKNICRLILTFCSHFGLTFYCVFSFSPICILMFVCSEMLCSVIPPRSHTCLPLANEDASEGGIIMHWFISLLKTISPSTWSQNNGANKRIPNTMLPLWRRKKSTSRCTRDQPTLITHCWFKILCAFTQNDIYLW